MPSCPPPSSALCQNSFTNLQHGGECLCRNSLKTTSEAAMESVRNSSNESYAQLTHNLLSSRENKEKLKAKGITTQGPKKESFRGMDPMESSYGVVSYGENYSLVAFGLFAILLLLYKTTNNK